MKTKKIVIVSINTIILLIIAVIEFYSCVQSYSSGLNRDMVSINGAFKLSDDIIEDGSVLMSSGTEVYISVAHENGARVYSENFGRTYIKYDVPYSSFENGEDIQQLYYDELKRINKDADNLLKDYIERGILVILAVCVINIMINFFLINKMKMSIYIIVSIILLFVGIISCVTLFA